MFLAPSLHLLTRCLHFFLPLAAAWMLGVAGTAHATPLPVRFDFRVLPITVNTPAVVEMGSVTPRNTLTVTASVQTNGTGIVTQVTGISLTGLSGPLSLSACSGASTCITASVAGPVTGNWTWSAAFGSGFGTIAVPGEIRAQFLMAAAPGAVTLTLPLSQAFNLGFAAATVPLPTTHGQALSGSGTVLGSLWVDTTALNFTFPTSATITAIGGVSTPGGLSTSQWRIGNTLNTVTPTFIASSRFNPDLFVFSSNGAPAFIGLSMTVVPEPATGLLTGLGCIGLAFMGRGLRKRRQTE